MISIVQPSILRKGFTLVEFLITMSVIGIISAVSIGTYQDYADTQRTSVATDDFAAVLATAKSRALSQVKPAACGASALDGYRVVVCPGGCSTTQAYVLEAYCGGTGHQVGEPFQLPSGVTFSTQSEQSILFRTITGAVESSGNVQIQSGQKVKSVSVNSAGVIALSGLGVVTPTGGPTHTITPTVTITPTPTITPTSPPPTNTPIPTNTPTPTSAPPTSTPTATVTPTPTSALTILAYTNPEAQGSETTQEYKNTLLEPQGDVVLTEVGVYTSGATGGYTYQVQAVTSTGSNVFNSAATPLRTGTTTSSGSPTSGYFTAVLSTPLLLNDDSEYVLRFNLTNGTIYRGTTAVQINPIWFPDRSSGTTNNVNTNGSYSIKVGYALAPTATPTLTPTITPTPSNTPIPTPTRTPTPSPSPTIGPTVTPAPGSTIAAFSNPTSENNHTSSSFKSTLIMPQQAMTITQIGAYITGGAGGETYEFRQSDASGGVTGTLLRSGTLSATPVDGSYYIVNIAPLALSQGSFYVFRTTNSGTIYRNGSPVTDGAIFFLQRGSGNTSPADTNGTYSIRFTFN